MGLTEWIEDTGRGLGDLGRTADETKVKFEEQARAAASFSTRIQEASSSATEAARAADEALSRIEQAAERGQARISDLLAKTRAALQEADGGFAGFAKNLLDLAGEGGPLSLLKGAARDIRVEVGDEVRLLSSLLAEARSAGQENLLGLQRDVEKGRRTIEQTLAALKESTDNAAQAALLTFQQYQEGSDKSAEATRELVKAIELLQRDTAPGSKTFLNLEALLKLIDRVNQEKDRLDELMISRSGSTRSCKLKPRTNTNAPGTPGVRYRARLR